MDPAGGSEIFLLGCFLQFGEETYVLIFNFWEVKNKSVWHSDKIAKGNLFETEGLKYRYMEGYLPEGLCFICLPGRSLILLYWCAYLVIPLDVQYPYCSVRASQFFEGSSSCPASQSPDNRATHCFKESEWGAIFKQTVKLIPENKEFSRRFRCWSVCHYQTSVKRFSFLHQIESYYCVELDPAELTPTRWLLIPWQIHLHV